MVRVIIDEQAETPAAEPRSRAGARSPIPWIVIGAGVLVLFANLLIPWETASATSSSPSRSTFYSTTFPGGQPAQWVLAAGIYAIVAGIAWIVARNALPADVLTARRESSFLILLLALPCYLLLHGAGLGLGSSLSENSRAGTGSSVSYAGIAFALVGIAAGFFIYRASQERNPSGAAAHHLLLAALASALVFQTLPWFGGWDGDAASTSLWRIDAAMLFTTGDGIEPVGVAIFIIVAIATIWGIALAWLPARHRIEPVLSEAAFAGCLVALALAATGLGRYVGAMVAADASSGESVRLAIAPLALVLVAAIGLRLLLTTRSAPGGD